MCKAVKIIYYYYNLLIYNYIMINHNYNLINYNYNLISYIHNLSREMCEAVKTPIIRIKLILGLALQSSQILRCHHHHYLSLSDIFRIFIKWMIIFSGSLHAFFVSWHFLEFFNRVVIF